ncbi:MAG: AbrB/MazE/SpoVT family DNA-binding domain-containing protein [Candidatus Rokubacteria bacterium]|nr:AbrB/MazE/SpoVT family DNA-binding domain-containing protein [Candidatus Rokubacteria bacterium]
MSPIAHSKLTTQGQVSVPAVVRRRLGVGPGAVLEWSEDGGAIVVRRAGRYSSEDVHRALFPKHAPKRKTLEQLEEGIRRHARKRHARR